MDKDVTRAHPIYHWLCFLHIQVFASGCRHALNVQFCPRSKRFENECVSFKVKETKTKMKISHVLTSFVYTTYFGWFPLWAFNFWGVILGSFMLRSSNIFSKISSEQATTTTAMSSCVVRDKPRILWALKSDNTCNQKYYSQFYLLSENRKPFPPKWNVQDVKSLSPTK